MFEVEPYRTPPGKFDFPFIYIFDTGAANLVDGRNYQNLSVQLQGDSEFVLRDIIGVTNVIALPANGGRFNYRNASGSYAAGNPSTGIVVGDNWPVLPEKVYPKEAGAIYFDLYNTLASIFVNCAQGCPPPPAQNVFQSQLAFRGVKRFDGHAGYSTGATPYRWRPCKYTYSFNLTIDWNAFVVNTQTPVIPRRFYQNMDSYDFELLRIQITRTTSVQQRGALTVNDFQIMLYDANMHQTSNLPVNLTYINSGRPAANTYPQFQPALSPTLVYPAGSAIPFDIVSGVCNGSQSPDTYNICFEGIWRLPL